MTHALYAMLLPFVVQPTTGGTNCHFAIGEDFNIGPGTVQDGEVTYAAKLTTDDLHLDWSRPAVERHRQVRLGGAWTTWRGKRLKVHAADLLDGDGVGAEVAADGTVGGLRLTTVQPEGKGPMSWRDLANGARITAPEILGT